MVLLRTYKKKLEGIKVTGITQDSRQVSPGFCFVAIRGTAVDGHHFIGEAIKRGASMIVVEKGILIPVKIPDSIGVMAVENTQIALGELSHAFYGYPAEKLTCIGATGTNGKTTITYLLESILKTAGKIPGVLGTITYRWPGGSLQSSHTTPSAPELAQTIWQMRKDGGIDTLVMEVSSHAIEQHRIEGIDFDVGIFSNITQDHLDYHGSMENYISIKRKFFEYYLEKNPESIAVFNMDDPSGLAFYQAHRGKKVSYGIRHHGADIQAIEWDSTLGGTQLVAHVFGRKVEITSPLIGEFNIYNVLSVLAAGWALGLALDDIIMGISNLKGVPGRMERVERGQNFHVFVDYSHTPDSLEKALITLRNLKPNRIITVFGCGGDRDREKRPLMGGIAARLSDYVIITSDNPRSEDPATIAHAAEQGVTKEGAQKDTHYSVILDRHEAINEAINKAQAEDVVLIAGKGHENYQVLGHSTIDFDDKKVAREALRKKAF